MISYIFIFKVFYVIVCVQKTCYSEHYTWGRQRKSKTLSSGLSFTRELDIDDAFLDVGKPLILTPYINRGWIKAARNLSTVNPQIGEWPSYSGYLTVNPGCGSNIYFWFIPAKNNWNSAPLLLWLQGGPGCGSLYGLFEEIGPFNHFRGGLRDRNYTWNRDNNIIYIDQPVGSGYSFSVKKCYAKNMATVTKELYSALIQFLQMFPELRENKFFITGESFAGHYIPALAVHIHKQNPTAVVKINLAGILIGNPLTKLSCHDYATFLFEWGIASRHLRAEIVKHQKLLKTHVQAGQYIKAWKDWDYIINDLIQDKTFLTSRECMIEEPPEQSDYISWVTTQAVRRQLHVGDTEYNDNNDEVYDKLIGTIAEPMTIEIEELLEARNYSVGFYSGNLDLVCLTTSTECVLGGLRWWGSEEYRTARRKPFTVNGDSVAGWATMAGPLYLVIIKDSGHTVPSYQPKVTYTLITKVTSAPQGVNPVSLLDLI